VRAVLTSIGVIIGSASIVLVVTVALTSQKFVISQIEAMGSNLVWVEMIKTPEKAQPLSYELTPTIWPRRRRRLPTPKSSRDSTTCRWPWSSAEGRGRCG